MKQETNFKLNTNDMGCSDIASLANILNWLSDHPKITDLIFGFNINSGNVYAYSENNCTTIFSSFGHQVEFMKNDEEEEEISEAEFLELNN